VWAQELAEDGTVAREYDDTPAGLGRIAATTAKQVILQRLRTPRTRSGTGEFAARRATSSRASSSRGADPRLVMVDLGRSRRSCRAAEQVPGEKYEHGSGCRCYVVGVRRAARAPRSPSRGPTPPGRKLFALEVPEIADGTWRSAAIAREAGTAPRSPSGPEPAA
jgi:N utilization substance protein A